MIDNDSMNGGWNRTYTILIGTWVAVKGAKDKNIIRRTNRTLLLFRRACSSTSNFLLIANVVQYSIP